MQITLVGKYSSLLMRIILIRIIRNAIRNH